MPTLPMLKIMTLNVGRFLQPRTRAFLENLAKAKDVPDVLCIQDVPERDLSLFKHWPEKTFAPMTNHLINGERAVVGIAMFSRFPMTNVVSCTTWGDGVLKDLQGVNDKNERYLGAESDRLVEKTEDRVAICATVVRDDETFNIATTHGAWVRGGVPSDYQRQSTRKLIGFLKEEGQKRDGLLLVGDLNFGRGSEMYKLFTKDPLCGGFTDRMPPEIESTLDPDHPASKSGRKVVIDWFFDNNRHDRMYVVSDVRLISGVSDHCALVATIQKEFGL